MVAGAAQILRSVNNARPERIAEDSHLRKILSLVPVLGILPSLITEMSLRQKIEATQKSDVSTIIELVELKNQYLVINGARNLLTVACLAVGLFKTIMLSTNACYLLFTVSAFSYFYRYSKNVQVIDQLETSGWQDDIKIM